MLSRPAIANHCSNMHGKYMRYLMAGEEPKDPYCLNWRELVANPANFLASMPVGLFYKSFDPRMNNVEHIRSSLVSDTDEEQEMPDPEIQQDAPE